MVRPAWANDPVRYAGGSVATSRAYHAGQVEGDDPDSKGYPGSPGCGLGVGLTTPRRKNITVTKHQRKRRRSNPTQGCTASGR